MAFEYLIFYASLRLQFLDVETNPGVPRNVPTICRILCSSVVVGGILMSAQTRVLIAMCCVCVLYLFCIDQSFTCH